MTRLSKRRLAHAFLNMRERRSHRDAVRALAAAIRDARLVHEIELIVREIARDALVRGVCMASVATARPVSHAQRESVDGLLRRLTGATVLHVDYHTDPALIGGFIATLPSGVLDASLAGRLHRLR